MITYRKVGGIHFLKIGRFGFNFYVSKPRQAPRKLPGTVFPAFTKAERTAHLQWCAARAYDRD